MIRVVERLNTNASDPADLDDLDSSHLGLILAARRARLKTA